MRDHWALGRPLLSHPIVLTFDTVSEGLPPERVRQLIGAGWEVAAHSLTHPDLTRLSAERLRLEATLRSLGAVP